MKKLLFLLVALNAQLVFSQKKFEGKIVYVFHRATSEKEMELEAYFGKEKIKVIVKENEKDNLLIDFTNGIVHFLDATTRTYHTDSLKKDHSGMLPDIKIAPAENKDILKYAATAYSAVDTVKRDSMIFTIWYADSLYFPFDKAYANTEMVPIFGNGNNVSLGIAMQTGKSKSKTALLITPVSIEPQQLPDSIFTIPPDYTLQAIEEPIADSMIMAADSIVKAAVDAAKKTTKNKSKQTTHKRLQKNSAVKPKE